jgi:2-dehydropantoate 2-reductase
MASQYILHASARFPFKPSVVKTTAEAARQGPWHFLVICSKSFPGSSPSLSDIFRPVIGPSTAIVLLQNDIGIEEEIAAEYPDNPILSGLVYIPATQIRPGVIDNGASRRSNLNLLEIGPYPALAPISHKLAAENFALLVRREVGNAEAFDDIQPRRWSKLIVNASWNPITLFHSALILNIKYHLQTQYTYYETSCLKLSALQ